LSTAGLIYRVRRTSGAGLPLKAGIKENFFKTIFLDVGLMQAINGLYSNTIREKDLTAIYKGSVAEQFTGQEIIASHTPYIKPVLYYWAREAKNSNAEVDYLVEKESKIIPIEIKSGATGTLRSLHQFVDLVIHPYAVRMYAGELKIEKLRTPRGKSYLLMNLPYYLGTKIPEYIAWFVDNK